MSFKQVAALLRRAGEAARRAVADLENSFGGTGRLDHEFARRVPALEPAFARRAGPRFRTPIRAPDRGVREFSTRGAARAACVARPVRPACTPIRSLAYSLEHPPVRYGTVMRPRVLSTSALGMLKRPFAFALRLPRIPVHATQCAAVDFDLAPRILLGGRTLSTATAESLCDSISGQIAHLKAVSRDVQRLAQLGELSIGFANNRLRVSFDNRSSSEVETLVRDIGLSRAIVSEVCKFSDQSVPPALGWRFDEVSPGLSDSLSSLSEESVWTEL